MTPQTDNAWNSGASIEFPAALLQGPMYDAAADAAVNYGAIGSYIGHEITHAFDDEGRKIDADGRQRDWWTKEDAKQFELRSGQLGAQYSKYEALPGQFVNAKATMGENIADLGGVNIALDAYHASLNGSVAPTIDGITADQRFFLGWAQAWRGKLTDQATVSLLRSDPHSPRRFRVNGPLRNIDAWYAAFNVHEGRKWHLPQSERVRLW